MSTVHVVPLRDLIDHAVPGGIPESAIAESGTNAWLCIEAVGGDESCACNPTLEHVPSEDDGPDGWLWTHHSLDGRELTE